MGRCHPPGTLQPFGAVCAGVPLDRAEREVQAACAFPQACPFAEHVVDLLPALQLLLSALAGLQRCRASPAGGVRRDFLLHGLSQAVPQVPAVADPDRAGQRAADRLAVGTRPVTAHHLHARMTAQPLLDQVCGAAGQHVNAAAGLGVDQHGRVDQAAAQREVIDPEHPRHRQRGQRDLEEDPQRGMPGDQDAQCRQQPRRGPAC